MSKIKRVSDRVVQARLSINDTEKFEKLRIQNGLTVGEFTRELVSKALNYLDGRKN